MNNDYFSTEGLTSASANHLANMAKEYAQRIAQPVMNLRLYSENVTLLLNNSTTTIHTENDTLDDIPSVISKTAKCYSLISWLRESITAKDDETTRLQHMTFNLWVQEQNITLPEEPRMPTMPTSPSKAISEQVFTVKERNRYLELKTTLSIYGQFIHPDGLLTRQAKELQRIANSPNTITGQGQDTLIHHYDIDMDGADRMEKLFYQLQGEHRQLQAELNGMEHRLQMEGEKEFAARQSEYDQKMTEYRKQKADYDAQMQLLHNDFNKWKQSEVERVSALRIIIPNDLQGIYAEVNGL